MSPAPSGSEQWMPNGFPPPSFVVETERAGTFAGARGRWLAAAALLGVVLLIAGLLLLANQDDDDGTDLAAGTTSTSFEEFPTTPTTALDPTATLPEASTLPGGAVDPNATTSTTAAGGGGGTGTTAATAAPGPTTAPGVLAVTAGTVAIPKVDSTVGPQTGKVGLRNTGAGPLTYTTASNFGGLTVDKPTGTIAPGGSTEITITLNGSGAAEGGFSGLLSFGGTGGTQRVTVTSTIGRPPTITDSAGEVCAPEGPLCSRQIKLEPNAGGQNPCTVPWRFRVAVADESQISSVKADTTDPDIVLKTGALPGSPTGPSGVWYSDVQQKIAAGTTFKWTIEAVDQFGNVKRSTERTITCPA